MNSGGITMSNNEPKDLKTIDDLTPDPNNANVGTERGLYMLDDSLTEVGAGRSIVVDRDGMILAGEKTADRAADKQFPIQVVKSDGTVLIVVQRTDLDIDGIGEEARRAQRLALYDNRTSEIGLEWSSDVLENLVTIDPDILDGLFFGSELTELLEIDIPKPGSGNSGEQSGGLYDGRTITCPKCGHEFTTE